MMQKPYFSFAGMVIVCVMALSACASPEPPAPTLDMNLIFTQVGATMAMGFTQTAQAMPTATNTPEPTPSPAASTTPPPLVLTTPTLVVPPTPTGPTPLPVNPATANGCYNAALVSEASNPSRTDFKAGDVFTKTWRLINTGTCEWTGEFKIAHASGDMFGSDTTKIRQRVGVGVIAEVSLEMTAPSGVSGTVVSNWQLVTDTGLSFGPVLAVSIILPGSNATATSVGCYNSALVSEGSIPKLDPGTEFTKTWQIKNSGSCDWTSDFKITYVGGDLLGSDTEKIRQRVGAGSSANISLDMVAPGSSGKYSSSWQMATEDGSTFGQVFTFEIEVR